VKRTLCSAALSLVLVASLNSATLWRDPGPVESLDLAGGPGGKAKAPQAPFIFMSEVKGGTAPKVTVRDARGTEWIVKFGEEVKAENFASRIAWAAGYFALPTYFVAEGQIQGVTELGRAASVIDRSNNGAFRNARFQLKDPALANPAGKWNLSESNLKGSRELAGYKVLFVLLSNWDVKPENLSVVNVGGDQVYALTDWGASMGRSAELTGRSKWDCKLYSTDTPSLIEGVDNGFVVFNYQGKQGIEIRKAIQVEDVQWLMQRLGKLSDAQIDAALRASGATPDEVACFGKAFRSRLNQLRMVAGQKLSDDAATTRTRREIRTTVPKPAQD
jgi:hypothetical protein